MSDDGFDHVFLHCAVQLGLVDDDLVGEVKRRVAANDFRPPWLILVDSAGLSFDHIDRIKSEVAKLREDCPRCQKPRYRLEGELIGSCPHCSGPKQSACGDISQHTFVPVNLDDSPDPQSAPLDDHWNRLKEDWED